MIKTQIKPQPSLNQTIKSFITLNNVVILNTNTSKTPADKQTAGSRFQELISLNQIRRDSEDLNQNIKYNLQLTSFFYIFNFSFNKYFHVFIFL